MSTDNPTPQPPTPDPQQVVCECGHRVGDHYLQYFHPELCKGSLDCKCKLNQNEVTLESELTRLKSACAKEHESVQKLDEENQRLREQMNPLTDYLEQNYYVEQRKVMDEWITEARNMEEPLWKFTDRLILKLQEVASTYVHGANLTAVISSNRQLRAALEITAIKCYNIGCLRGHEDTVEGVFIVIMPQDLATYNEEIVAEMLQDGSLPEAQEALNQTTESEK